MNTNGHHAQHPSAPQGGFAVANDLRDRLIAICGGLETTGRRLSDPGAADTAAKLAQRTADDAFRVMVIGDFKRGKSTFVNALLGAKVLPVKATPATAVITEVRYGDTPAARLWPADPALPGEDVSPEELTARIIIDNQDPDKPSPFRLAEVFWPLELCRNNVVLIDSPGLNEHVRRDEITLKELRDADAVIFLQHSIAPMSSTESQFLTTSLSAHDPFFVFTYFDAIDDGERESVKAAAITRITVLRGINRDRDRFFFVDGRTALNARIAGNDVAYAESGVAALEKELEHFLVNDRFRIKISTPARAARTVAGELERGIPHRIALLERDAADLARAWENAQEPLKALRAEAHTITSDLDNQQRSLQDQVESLLEGRIKSAADEVRAIAEEAHIETKLTLALWEVPAKAKAVAQEIAQSTANEIEARISRWVEQSLEPVISRELKSITERLNTQLGSFEANLEALRINITGIGDAAAAGQNQAEPPLTRFLSGVGGFALGGIAGGLVGAQFGPREALRTLLPTVAIYLAWLVTPFGLPTLIGALLVQTVTQSGGAFKRLQGKIRSVVGEEMSKLIRQQAADMARGAARAFAEEQIKPIAQEVRRGLDSRLETLQLSVTQAQETKERGDAAVKQETADLSTVRDELQRTAAELDELLKEVSSS